MRVKFLAVLATLLLVSSLCFAQGARNPDYQHEGKTSLGGGISATGLNTTGNPGFLSLFSTNLDEDAYEWYLWVDMETTGQGKLWICSRPTLDDWSASFPLGDWRYGLTTYAPSNSYGCELVGNQS